MTRDDLRRFCALDIDFYSIGLMEPGVPQEPYFCDPPEGEQVGRTGCDGVHFILLPGDERVYCVDPAMGEEGTYVLPVAESFRQFLSFALFCGGADPIAQIWWLSRPRFDALAAEDRQTGWPERDAALEAVAGAFDLEPADPYDAVKALQGAFDPSALRFSAEYYDTLGLERPGSSSPHQK